MASSLGSGETGIAAKLSRKVINGRVGAVRRVFCWAHDLKGGKATYAFPPHSVTVITWE
jgi:hypothetical protein